VSRVYKTGPDGQPLARQPRNYPHTVRDDYVAKPGELVRRHEGVDFSSRPGRHRDAAPLDFKAGVYGEVIKAGDGPWGTIAVRTADGSVMQYLHTSKCYLQVGDRVTADTKLGVTGKTGANAIHLHIQARDRDGKYASPDATFMTSRNRRAEELIAELERLNEALTALLGRDAGPDALKAHNAQVTAVVRELETLGVQISTETVK
jgi:murein DD-endopeptidase MepM/ murein hydrolase activator NlpD